MTDTVKKELEKFELLVQDGKIASFEVCLRNKGLFLKATDSALEQEVSLPEDMLQSLGNFFYGLPSIAYQTFDYTSLKSFVNARVTLDRLLSKDVA